MHMQKSYLRLLCKAKLIAVLGVGWPWLVGTKSDSREWFFKSKTCIIHVDEFKLLSLFCDLKQ